MCSAAACHSPGSTDQNHDETHDPAAAFLLATLPVRVWVVQHDSSLRQAPGRGCSVSNPRRPGSRTHLDRDGGGRRIGSGKAVASKEPFHADVNPDDGTFTVPGPEGCGIPPGKYRVSIIRKPDPSKPHPDEARSEKASIANSITSRTSSGPELSNHPGTENLRRVLDRSRQGRCHDPGG